MQGRKNPRDFVYIDEFWEADGGWLQYFTANKVWVFVDEYQAELTGDEDYSRIIIRSGHDRGWLYHRSISQKPKVITTLGKITLPVSQQQLEALGFTPWDDSYL